MKILFVTQFFWPERRTAPTNLGALAEDLATQGHDILILTGVPNHPDGKVYDGYKMKAWQTQNARGFRILRLPLYPDHSNSGFRRLLNYASFTLSATTLGIWHTRHFQPDVIFSYYAPLTMGWIIRVIRLFHQAPVVYWVTDIWPENFRALGIVKNERAYYWLRRFEDWGYKQANIICVDSPGYKQNLLMKGVSESKIEVVAEWADEHLFFPVKRDDALGQEYGLTGKFNIIYGGNLGPAQKLDVVIEAAALITDLGNIQFVFIGGGNAEGHLKEIAQKNALTNIIFIPHQPMERMRHFFAWSDVLLVHLKKDPIFELQLPSKILAYMACGRPILNGVTGTVAEIIAQAECGHSCSPENAKSIANLAQKFYIMSRTERELMGKKGREAYLANYSRSVQVTKIETIFKESLSM